MKNIKYISASAGSGKTYTLTQELTNAIKSKAVEPENVILTTFSKAAAAEFKEKAKTMFYENNLVLEADRLDQALIGTIHSVAETLIMKYWYVLGLSPKINAIAEEDLQMFKDQSLLNVLTEEDISFFNSMAEDFSIKISQSTKIDYDFWKEDLSNILEYSINYGIEDFKPSIAYTWSLTKQLVNGEHHIKVNTVALEHLLGDADDLNEADDSDEQDSIRIAIKAQKRNLLTQDPASFKYALGVLKFLDKLPWKELQEEKDEIKDGLNNLYCTEEVRDYCNEYMERMFSLADKWRKQYKSFKTENHLIDFSDMEKYFYELLDNEEVVAEIKATYKYVFVDEFQDCSPIQVKIFNKLSEIVEHSIWVGDKKQAIYGFRGSDTELTTAVMDIIEENKKKGVEGFTTDILGNSWRTLPAIVNFTNEAFVKIFNKSQEQRDEVCLVSKRKKSEGNGKVGFWWLTQGRQEDRANTIAGNIIDLINNGENPWDIAVLARKRSHLTNVINCLRDKGVPVYVDEEGASEYPTVGLVTSILELIADETSELAKAQIAFLTEPNYKLGKILDDKMAYNDAGNQQPGFYDNIPLVQKVLEERNRFKLQGVSSMLHTLIIELDLFNFAKRLTDSAVSAKLLHALVDFAVKYEDHCALLHLPSSITGFLKYLGENSLPVSGSTKGVQFFTFHKSKGLEWKTVIVMDCDDDFLYQHRFIKYNILGAQHVRLTPPSKSNLFPEVVISVLPNLFGGSNGIAKEWLNIITQSERFMEVTRSEKEETKRLMYVAMTRPRDKLILALNGKGKQPKPLSAFQKMDVLIPSNYLGASCDLFGTGVFADRLPNAAEDIQYNHKSEQNAVVNLSVKPEKNPLPKKLQPSSMPGGTVKASLYDCGSSITVTGSPDYAALGTCIHNIFCVADNKNEQEITQMVKAYGFSENILNPGEIKKAWESLTNYLSKTYGPAKNKFHELPFTQELNTRQIVNGSMDFVWECDKGFVLVDFKTYPGSKESITDQNSPHYVGKYKGQLECYEQALTAAGKKVIAKLLYYPVVGVICAI